MHFIPLDFEHFGQWGQEAISYLQDLSRDQQMKTVQKTRMNSSATGERVFWPQYRNIMPILLQDRYQDGRVKKRVEPLCNTISPALAYKQTNLWSHS